MSKVKNTITVDIETRGLYYDAIDAGIIFLEPAEEHMWWTTIKGENVRIDKMDTEHLKNTIAMLKKNGRWKDSKDRMRPVFKNLQKEFLKRTTKAEEVLYGK